MKPFSPPSGKVGIVTFHQADNYGAVLQAYALASALKKLALEPWFLKVKTPWRQQLKSWFRQRFRQPPAPAAPAGWETEIEAYLREEKQRKYDSFRARYLPETDRPGFIGCREYLFFLAGSDQVWNPRITGGNPDYYLAFAPRAKRNSYAASFGYAGTEAAAGRIPHYLRALKHLSLREEMTPELYRRTGLVPEQLRLDPDPVFLPDRREWEALDNGSAADESPVVLYFMQFNPEMYRRARELSEVKRLPLRIICAGSPFASPVPEQIDGTAGPEDFISLLRHASHIVTNSFHALQFALCFQCPFDQYDLTGNGAPGNHRFQQLLKTAGLPAHPRQYDWPRVEEILHRKREQALDYLKMLKKEYTPC